jgi:hypothetical protein
VESPITEPEKPVESPITEPEKPVESPITEPEKPVKARRGELGATKIADHARTNSRYGGHEREGSMLFRWIVTLGK